jgi:hypothetical protein
MEYHKTRDVKHVQSILGHKSCLSTDIYINIERAMFNEADSQYHAAVASTIEEANKLIEAGFEFVTDMEGRKLFRKRK